MRRRAKYYWFCLASYWGDQWSFASSVTRGEHPFKVQRDNNAFSEKLAKRHGGPIQIWEIVSWREITEDEYLMHPEHAP